MSAHDALTRDRNGIPNQYSTPGQMMKTLSTGLCTLTILVVISSLRPVQAQTTAAATGSAAPFSYDITREVTLTGTVSSVLMKATPGMIVGSHLLLATPSGPVDASLGRFGLRGYGAVSVATGQQIEATGVMRTINDKPVLLVRAVKGGGEVYAVRNEHGFLLSPQARQRAGQTAGQNGESQ
jgi:hypothetical protein